MTALWEGTEFEQLAAAIGKNPVLLDAWRMGVAEQTVADLLGYEYGENSVPEVAREVAARLMRALVSCQNIDGTIMECAALVKQAKSRAN